MKFATPRLFATMLAMALPAFAADPAVLSADDMVDAVHVFEHDTTSLRRVVGRPVALALRKIPRTPYFEFGQGAGILVECPRSGAFTGGPVASTVKSLALTYAHGPDVTAVLTLSNCAE